MNIELDFLRTYWINDYGLHRNKLVIWIQMAGTRSIQTSEYLKNRFFFSSNINNKKTENYSKYG